MKGMIWSGAALFVCAAVILGTGTAQAASVLIDFRGDGGLDKTGESKYTFGPVDGITVEATATSQVDHGDPHNPAWIGQYDSGLGVTNSPGDGSHTVDGSGWTDTIWLVFNQKVTITHVWFSYVSDHKDDVRLLDENGDKIEDYDLPKMSHHSPYYSLLDLTGEGIMGMEFGFNAPYKNDDWKLAAIKVKPHVIIPTPTAAMAGSVLLGGLALLRRKRRV